MGATSTGRERPWRAVAFIPDPTGQTLAGRKRVVAGRTSAKTRQGLSRFIARHTEAGHPVDVVQVIPLNMEAVS